MELEFKDYRAAMVDKVYQAQVKCGGCGDWTLTENLEVYKDAEGNKMAEATDVQCQNSGCGHNDKSIIFRGWPYSAPVKWRMVDGKPFVEGSDAKD